MRTAETAGRRGDRCADLGGSGLWFTLRAMRPCRNTQTVTARTGLLLTLFSVRPIILLVVNTSNRSTEKLEVLARKRAQEEQQ